MSNQLSIEQVAQMLGVDSDAIRAACEQNPSLAQQHEGQWSVPLDSLSRIAKAVGEATPDLSGWHAADGGASSGVDLYLGPAEADVEQFGSGGGGVLGDELEDSNQNMPTIMGFSGDLAGRDPGGPIPVGSPDEETADFEDSSFGEPSSADPGVLGDDLEGSSGNMPTLMGPSGSAAGDLAGTGPVSLSGDPDEEATDLGGAAVLSGELEGSGNMPTLMGPSGDLSGGFPDSGPVPLGDANEQSSQAPGREVPGGGAVLGDELEDSSRNMPTIMGFSGDLAGRDPGGPIPVGSPDEETADFEDSSFGEPSSADPGVLGDDLEGSSGNMPTLMGPSGSAAGDLAGGFPDNGPVPLGDANEHSPDFQAGAVLGNDLEGTGGNMPTLMGSSDDLAGSEPVTLGGAESPSEHGGSSVFGDDLEAPGGGMQTLLGASDEMANTEPVSLGGTDEEPADYDGGSVFGDDWEGPGGNMPTLVGSSDDLLGEPISLGGSDLQTGESSGSPGSGSSGEAGGAAVLGDELEGPSGNMQTVMGSADDFTNGGVEISLGSHTEGRVLGDHLEGTPGDMQTIMGPGTGSSGGAAADGVEISLGHPEEEAEGALSEDEHEGATGGMPTVLGTVEDLGEHQVSGPTRVEAGYQLGEEDEEEGDFAVLGDELEGPGGGDMQTIKGSSDQLDEEVRISTPQEPTDSDLVSEDVAIIRTDDGSSETHTGIGPAAEMVSVRGSGEEDEHIIIGFPPGSSDGGTAQTVIGLPDTTDDSGEPVTVSPGMGSSGGDIRMSTGADQSDESDVRLVPDAASDSDVTFAEFNDAPRLSEVDLREDDDFSESSVGPYDQFAPRLPSEEEGSRLPEESDLTINLEGPGLSAAGPNRPQAPDLAGPNLPNPEDWPRPEADLDLLAQEAGFPQNTQATSQGTGALDDDLEIPEEGLAGSTGSTGTTGPYPKGSQAAGFELDRPDFDVDEYADTELLDLNFVDSQPVESELAETDAPPRQARSPEIAQSEANDVDFPDPESDDTELFSLDPSQPKEGERDQKDSSSPEDLLGLPDDDLLSPHGGSQSTPKSPPPSDIDSLGTSDLDVLAPSSMNVGSSSVISGAGPGSDPSEPGGSELSGGVAIGDSGVLMGSLMSLEDEAGDETDESTSLVQVEGEEADEFVLEEAAQSPAGGGSDVTLNAGDSGIGIASSGLGPADSGIALEQLGIVEDIGEGDESAFMLEPADEEADSETSGSGSQLIMLDEPEAELDEAGPTLLSPEGDEGLLQPAGVAASGAGFDAGEAMASAFQQAPTSAAYGQAPGGPQGYAPAGAYQQPAAMMPGIPQTVPVTVDIPFGPLELVTLIFCLLVLGLGGLMMFDLVANMWGWQSISSTSKSIMDAVIDTVNY